MYGYRHPIALALLAAVAALWMAPAANACPFCSAQAAQTLGEEIRSSEVAVICRLAMDPPKPDREAGIFADVEKSRFEVVHILKGDEVLGKARYVEVLYFGQEPKGTMFYITAAGAPELAWNSPTPLKPEAVAYLRQLPNLPEKGPRRLSFFLKYLDNSNELIAADSYDEFARAPYEDVKALRDQIDHDRVLNLVRNPDISSSRRGLYLTLLGICGTPQDADILEEMIRNDRREVKTGLDATIACFLTLRGAEGLPLVEELFLKNPQAAYSDTYAALQAIRFHGEQEAIIPRDRLLESMRYVLDRPTLADLVIPDLARWQDWSVMDRLVKLFEEADEKTSWVRMPVVNYLRACPLPKAAEALEHLKQIDPKAVQDALEFFPFVAPAAPGTTAGNTPDPGTPAPRAAVTAVAAKPPGQGPQSAPPGQTSAAESDGGAAGATPRTPQWLVNVAALLGVVLIFILAALLGGGRPRSAAPQG